MNPGAFLPALARDLPPGIIQDENRKKPGCCERPGFEVRATGPLFPTRLTLPFTTKNLEFEYRTANTEHHLQMEGKSMPVHKHTMVEEYEGMVAFGLSREVDEKSLMYYLQKFSDDDMLSALVPRLSDEEINRLFAIMSELMRSHLSDSEYHGLFLKDKSD
jgi:hypothetical protein